ncbi:MAG: hypothetical protein H6713_05410 [Myxococcales bacterium]|nr:hypothetical protein [Myxococcales bacterium]
MALWDYILDDDWKQRRDIRTLQLNTELDGETLQRVAQALEAANRRVDRLELLLEGLLMYMENQGAIDRQTLTVIMRELDRADGREDGKITRPSGDGP